MENEGTGAREASAVVAEDVMVDVIGIADAVDVDVTGIEDGIVAKAGVKVVAERCVPIASSRRGFLGRLRLRETQRLRARRKVW